MPHAILQLSPTMEYSLIKPTGGFVRNLLFQPNALSNPNSLPISFTKIQTSNTIFCGTHHPPHHQLQSRLSAPSPQRRLFNYQLTILHQQYPPPAALRAFHFHPAARQHQQFYSSFQTVTHHPTYTVSFICTAKSQLIPFPARYLLR